MPLLEVKGLVKCYGRRRVVNGVSFHVEPGEVVGLLGPNGAGKTTTFRMTTGMVRPDAGQVLFAGQECTNLPMYKRARLGMGYLSQEQSVFRKLTTEQNILAILEAMPPLRSLGRKLTRQERLDRTDKVLEQFNLSRVRKSKAYYLSGGEKRRLEIARCLVCEPLLILLDEPFTGIDPITIGDIQMIVRALRDQGIGILLTDHNVREALKITDRSYVITDGMVEAHGTPDEIIRHPLVIAKYLGQSFADDRFAPLSGGMSVSLPPQQEVLAFPAMPSAVSQPSLAQPPAVHSILQQERLRQLVDKLKSADAAAAERELLQAGRLALPALIESLERRDLEIRRVAFGVVQMILGGAAFFDAYAPEVQRRQQIELLREQFLRKAG
jgi:lipopolysaccharide export system ATP-binding protein